MTGAPRPRGARPWLLGLGAALMLSLALQGALQAGRGASALLPGPADTSPRPGDVSYGSPSAPVVVIALVSLTCSHCRAWEAGQLPAVLREQVETGRARLVLRAFPLDAVALTGAALLACVPEERRGTAHAALMAAEGGWTPGDPASAAAAAGLAGQAASDAAACAARPETGRELARNVLEAKREWGVAATPTFVAGRAVRPGALPAAAVSALVDAASAR